MKRSDRGLATLAWITAIGLFLVLVLGFVVTETQSGRGCGGSWPLCHGKFIPAFALHTLIEFSHRSLAGIVGLLVLALTIWAWRQAGGRPFVKVLAATGLLFVIVQAGVGAADVIHPQSASVLALHFGFSLIAFGAVALLAVVLRQGQGIPLSAPRGDLPLGRLRGLAIATFVYIYGVVYLGAYVSHVGAEHACPGWPLCHGSLIPALKGDVAIVFLHRVAALGGLVLVLWLFSTARAFKASRKDLSQAAHVALALIVLQIASGAVLALSHFALFAILIHVALMAILFAAESYLFLHAVLGLKRSPALAGGQAVGQQGAR